MSPLVDLAIRATLLLALSGIAAALLGRGGASAAMRHAAWACGIGGVIVLPVLSLALPPLEIPILEAAPASTPIAISAAPAAVVPEPVHWGWFAWGVYAAIAALLLLRMLVGRLRLARLWRMAESDAGLQAEAAALARAAGIGRPVRLRLADGPVMPMTWGTLAPKLLLPAEALLWSDERRRFVLLHELAHVARLDALGTLAASFACAFYWFHPAVWFAAARLRIEQEHAADDLVLESGAAPLPYARDLLALASPVPALPAVAMARTSQLEHRLTAIVGARSRRRSGRGCLLASAFVTLGSTMLVAAAVPCPARPAPSVPVPPAAPFAQPAPIPSVPPVAQPRGVRAIPAAPAAPALAALPQAAAAPAAPSPLSVPSALAAPEPLVAPSPPPPLPRIPAIAPVPPIPPTPGAVPAVAATPATAPLPGLPGLPGIAGSAGK